MPQDSAMDLSTKPEDLTFQRHSRRAPSWYSATSQPRRDELHWVQSSPIDMHANWSDHNEELTRIPVSSQDLCSVGPLRRKVESAVDLSIIGPSRRKVESAVDLSIMGSSRRKVESAEELPNVPPSFFSRDNARRLNKLVDCPVAQPGNLLGWPSRLFSGDIAPHASRYGDACNLPPVLYGQGLGFPPAASSSMVLPGPGFEARNMAPFIGAENVDNRANFCISKSNPRMAPVSICAPPQPKQRSGFSIEDILSLPQRLDTVAETATCFPEDPKNDYQPLRNEIPQLSPNMNGRKLVCALPSSTPDPPLSDAENFNSPISSKDSGIVANCNDSPTLSTLSTENISSSCDLPPELAELISGIDISVLSPAEMCALKEKYKIYQKAQKNMTQLPLMLDADDFEEYQHYREMYKIRTPLITKTNVNMRRNVPTKSPYARDPNYLEKRRKNNEAAKRSRDARKLGGYELGIFEDFLYRRNARLQMELQVVLDKQKAVLGRISQKECVNRGPENKILLGADLIGINSSIIKTFAKPNLLACDNRGMQQYGLQLGIEPPKILPSFAHSRLLQGDNRAFHPYGLHANLQSLNQ